MSITLPQIERPLFKTAGILRVKIVSFTGRVHVTLRYEGRLT